MLAKLVPIEDPSCSRLLDFRSWKKVFQSSVSWDLAGDDVEVDGDSVVLVAEGMVELCLTIEVEGVVNEGAILMASLLRWVVIDAS